MKRALRALTTSAIAAALAFASGATGHGREPSASQVPTRLDSRGRPIGPNVSGIVQDDDFPLPYSSVRRYQPFIRSDRTHSAVADASPHPAGCSGGLLCGSCPSGQHGHPDCKGCRYCSDSSRSCAHCPPIKRHAVAKFVGPPTPFR